MAPLPASAAEPNQWTFDVSIYGLALGMSGDLGIGPVTADVDVGLDDVVNNLEFGFMGTVRVGYGPWALTTEGLYMGLQGTKNGVTAELDQWMVEPTISYRVSKYFEPLVGVRYNHLSGELRGPGVLPTPRIPTGTQDWWDPDRGRQPGTAVGQGFQPQVAGRRRWIRRRLGFHLAGVSLSGLAVRQMGIAPGSATAGCTWITRPAAAPADSSTTCSTKARSSGSRSISESANLTPQQAKKTRP